MNPHKFNFSKNQSHNNSLDKNSNSNQQNKL